MYLNSGSSVRCNKQKHRQPRNSLSWLLGPNTRFLLLVRTCKASRTPAWLATESMGRDTWNSTVRFKHLYRGSKEMPVAEGIKHKTVNYVLLWLFINKRYDTISLWYKSVIINMIIKSTFVFPKLKWIKLVYLISFYI